MRIDDLLDRGRTFSFEFFPPKTPAAAEQLTKALKDLEDLGPSFVSVTYGAGGTTRETTHDVVVGILRDTSMTPMAHLTCAANTRAELVDIVRRYRDAGIENMLALGGDPPAGLDLPPRELRHASELVELIGDVGGFSVGVAAHPEGHPASPNLESDRTFTAEKLAAADFAITQLFFEAQHYFDLVASLRALGVTKPVLPGIMPVTNLSQVQRMAQMSGSAFPSWLEERLRVAGDDRDEMHRIGVREAVALCSELLEGGAPGLHFFTLNRSTATREIYSGLGLG